jgi:general L-amino acid transport system permease protein
MSYVRVAAEPVRPAPIKLRGAIAPLLFGNLASILTTVLIILVAWAALPHFLSWAFIHGVWRGDGESCRNAGACWAFLHAKLPFILLGIYPDTERWRPIVVVATLIFLTLWTMPPRNWTRATLLGWLLAVPLCLLLMTGGVAGLRFVPTGSWGGLPITLLLTILSLALGLPLGILLAIARRSRFPVYRLVAATFIETARAMPLLTLLFIAALMAPLLLPDGWTIDNLIRALIAFTLSSSAYLAEVIRGGLQAIPRQQEEAARALGLGRADALIAIILPQAIRKVLPPLTSTIVVIIKNSSLVLVVGLFDLLSAGRVALSDPRWPTPYAETYLAIGLFYFTICYGFARYSLHLERTLKEAGR